MSVTKRTDLVWETEVAYRVTATVVRKGLNNYVTLTIPSDGGVCMTQVAACRLRDLLEEVIRDFEANPPEKAKPKDGFTTRWG